MIKDDLYFYACLPRRVIDGDTIEVDIDLGFDNWIFKERVRLDNLDCPEIRTRDLVEKEFGVLASSRVYELLFENSTKEHILFSKEYHRRDGFGRVIGDILINGTDSLRDTLINERHGVPWLPNDREQMERLHIENRDYILNSGVLDESTKTRIQDLMNEQNL